MKQMKRWTALMLAACLVVDGGAFNVLAAENSAGYVQEADEPASESGVESGGGQS